MSPEDEPDWELIEPETEQPKPPTLASQIFHWCMVTICLAIAFCIGGCLFYLFSFRKEHAMAETMDIAQQKFIVGGIIAVILVLYWRYKKMEP